MKVPRVVAIIIIVVIIASISVFSFVGRLPTPAPAATPDVLPNPTSSSPTLVLPTTTNPTSSGGITPGPVSPEPKIPLKTSPPSPSVSPANPAPTSSTQDTPSAPPAKSFTVHGNDESADLTTITVPKGTPVTITFVVLASGTYYGGLDFRSSVLNTGTIKPGASMTVSFNANQSFAFTPYWPASNVAKPYKVSIVAQ